MPQTELTNEGKINEFMNGLLKYIQDREKDEELQELQELEELEKIVEQQLKQEQQAKRKKFLKENKDFLTRLININDNLKRQTGELKSIRAKQITEDGQEIKLTPHQKILTKNEKKTT